jgi:steroid delta-isomerase-like uncharacterized protein
MLTAREISDAATDAYNKHDLAGFLVAVRPDVVVVTPDAGEIQGREQFADYSQQILDAFPDAVVEVVAKHDAANATVDEWIIRGTHTGPFSLPNGEELAPTGRRISVRGVDIATYENGEVVTSHTYYDQAEFLTQLGLIDPESKLG